MKKGLLATLVLICSISVYAENRAKIDHMTVNLKLPDNSNLTVDMDFDCGGYYDKTAMIVTSQQGAELLAIAYEALYGPAAGKVVMDKWLKKTKAEDPRLPTFIVVRPPAGKSYRPLKTAQTTFQQNSTHVFPEETSSSVNAPGTFNPDEVSGTCGAVDHPTNF